MTWETILRDTNFLLPGNITAQILYNQVNRSSAADLNDFTIKTINSQAT